MATHDLRRKAQRFTELVRRREAHLPLTDEEKEELQRGPTVEEYKPIIDAIRGERRAAIPAKKVREKTERVSKAKAASEPVDLDAFLSEEHESQ